MNIKADLPQIGRLLWRDKFLVRKDIHRIETAWRNILKLSKGPFLAREFSALDAFLRSCHHAYSDLQTACFKRYSPLYTAYQTAPIGKKWREDAIERAVYRDFEDPYRFN
ncbi:MAG: hypothetical protein ACPHRD_11525 [Paracoccaceae bacterium]|jgi:glutathione S-transferase|nr:hypothetical protein SPH72_17530 [Rhodobacterales bacterium FZCC0083]